MVNCEEALARLYLFLDRELSVQEVREVEHHLYCCDECARCFHFQAELKRLVRRQGTHECAPAGLRHRVEDLCLSFDPQSGQQSSTEKHTEGA